MTPTKAAVNQALMNEIAQLSKVIRTREAALTSLRQRPRTTIQHRIPNPRKRSRATGPKPPCVYYLRKCCATINCPFPHVDPPEEPGEKKNPTKTVEDSKPKRYYEQKTSPGECIPVAVPRNIRPKKSEMLFEGTCDMVSTVNPTNEVGLSVVDMERRERLLKKVALLKSRYASVKNSSASAISAPEFIPFRKNTS